MASVSIFSLNSSPMNLMLPSDRRRALSLEACSSTFRRSRSSSWRKGHTEMMRNKQVRTTLIRTEGHGQKTVLQVRQTSGFPYVFRCFQLLLLLLKDNVVVLVLFKLFLAAVEQELSEVDSGLWIICGGDFQLRTQERHVNLLKGTRAH